MLILKIFGWVLLGLLALFVLLLIWPLAVSARYSGGQLTAKVHVLSIPFTLWPMKARKPKKPKPEKAKTEAKPADEKAKPKKEKTTQQKAAMLRRLIAAGLAAAKPVMRNLRVVRVEVVLPVHAGDAAATALQVGQFQMGIGIVRGLLDGRLKVRFRRLEIFPDFTGMLQNRLHLACKVVVNPYIMVVAGFVFLKTYFSRRGRRYSKAAMRRALAAKRAAQARPAP